MCRPHREQARSYSFFVVNLALAYNPIPLWERACPGRRSDEGGVSGNIDVGYADSHIRILRSAGFVVNLEVLGNLPHDFVEGFSQK